MNTTIILAHIFGILFVVLGLSLTLYKKWTKLVVDEMMTSNALVWIAGLITTILGASAVALNNTWTSGLPLVITILGWATLLKGAAILALPQYTMKYYNKMNRENVFMFGGIIVTILGVLLVLT